MTEKASYFNEREHQTLTPARCAVHPSPACGRGAGSKRQG